MTSYEHVGPPAQGLGVVPITLYIPKCERCERCHRPHANTDSALAADP